MAIWKNLLGFVSGSGNRQKGLQEGAPSRYEEAALPVTLDSAMQLSSVWACTRLITEAVSSLHINIYRRDPETGVRVLDVDHRLNKLLNGKMNRWQGRQDFFETITYQLVMLGNAYCAVQRDVTGEIVNMIPLMSQQMEVRLKDNGAIQYLYNDGGTIKEYNESNCWHVKIFGNGIVGLSPLAFARNSIGIAQAAEKATTKVYKNGGKPSGAIRFDKVLNPQQRKDIRENFADITSGSNDRLFVLEAGSEFQPISLSPQDIELLSSRRFQVEDIARIFGVPSVLINDTGASTVWGSGIQQIVQGFYKLTLRPYIERYEASMKIWLLKPEERPFYDIEFDFTTLVMPELGERIKMYKEAIQGGVMTPNQTRAIEGWQPKDGGDELYMQKQMVKLSKIDDVMSGGSNERTSEI